MPKTTVLVVLPFAPSKANVKSFLSEIKSIIKTNIPAKTENLILLLNPKIRGWANYFSHAVSSSAFSYVDCQIMGALWRWMKHRHPNKRVSWIARKYLKRKDIISSRLGASFKDKDGNQIPIFIRHACDTPIRRHIKIRSDANPYNPKFKEYFEYRGNTSNTRMSNGCRKSVLHRNWWVSKMALLGLEQCDWETIKHCS